MLGGLLSGIGQALGGLGGAVGGALGAVGQGIGGALGIPGQGMGAGAPLKIAPQRPVPMMNPTGYGQQPQMGGPMGGLLSGQQRMPQMANPMGNNAPMMQGPMGQPMGNQGGIPDAMQRMNQMTSPLDGGMQMPQRPPKPQGGIPSKVMDTMANAFGVGKARAAGPGDINMTKTIEGAPKGASFQGDLQLANDTGVDPSGNKFFEPGTWKASDNAAKSIAQFEGFYEKPYWDYKQWSYGYGSKAPGKDASISKSDAMDMLNQRIPEYTKHIKSAVTVPLTQNQVDALASFTYNVGPGWTKNSSVIDSLNSGDYQGAADNMLKYNKAGGKVLKGLENRRAAERKLFLQGM